MQVVIAYVTPEDRRERIYVCDAVRLRDDVLECCHVAKIRYFALTGILAIVSVVTGDTLSVSALEEFLASEAMVTAQ